MSVFIKISFIISGIALWLFTQKLLGQRKMNSEGHIGDWIHIWTEKYTDYLHAQPRVANGLLISSSFIIDALGVFLIVQSLIGDSVRPFLAVLVLFCLRQVNQAVTVLPLPEKMIWRDPGVPSLFVTYGVSNDLFFSGHTALAVLGALEIAQLGGGFFMFLACAIVIFEAAAVLLLRAHWTMDVFAGAVTALWVHGVVSSFAPVVDKWLLSL